MALPTKGTPWHISTIAEVASVNRIPATAANVVPADLQAQALLRIKQEICKKFSDGQLSRQLASDASSADCTLCAAQDVGEPA